MQYIKIELTQEGVTREQKQELIKGVINGATINVDGGMGAGHNLS
jgi:hypothetical protein